MCNNTFNLTESTSCKVRILQAWAYCPVYFLGFLVNAAAIRAFIAKRSSWTDTHVYMFNLAVADFTVILLLPFRIMDSFFCLPKSQLCTVLINVHYINMYSSILTSVSISIQRFLAVIFPMQVSSWRWKKVMASVVCLLIWTVVLTISAVFIKENQPDKLWTCYERCKDKPLQLEFLLALLLFGFAVPLLIVVFCSTWVVCTLSKAEEMSEEKRSTVGIVMANMLVFIVCYTPFHIGLLINHLLTQPPDWKSEYLPAHEYLLVSEWIASTNCCFDCIGYYFLLRHVYL